MPNYDPLKTEGTPLDLPVKKDVWGTPTINPNVKLPDNTQGVFTIDTQAEPVDLSKEEVKIAPRKKIPWETIMDATSASLFGADVLLSKQNQMLQDQNYIRRERNIFQGSPVFNMDKTDQPIIMAEKGAKVRLSNLNPLNNVNAEGGEFMQLPDLTTEHIAGSKHSKGGVNISAPGGTKIFSNKLKPDGKKTFASLAKKHPVQDYLDILADPFADRIDKHTAQLMLPREQQALDNLFAMQQEMNNDSSGEECQDCLKAEDGKWIQHAHLEKGRCTPGSPNYDCPKGSPQWRLAQRFKHGDLHHEEGGVVKAFPTGGKVDSKNMSLEEFRKAVANPEITDEVLKTMYQEYKKDPVKYWEGAPNNLQGDPNRYVYNLFKSNPQLGDRLYEEYKKFLPNTKETKEQVLERMLSTSNHISELNRMAPKDVLLDYKLDEGLDNTNYQALAKKYGLNPVSDEDVESYEASYRAIARLKSNPKYDELLKGFDIDPVGLPDQQYGEMNYPDSPVTPVDRRAGNTFLGQMFKYNSDPINTTLDPEKPGEPYVPPAGNVYNGKVPKFQQTQSSMGRFPMYQAIPEMLGFAGAMNTFPYWTPDYSHWEMNPQELNIQPQLQSIDDSFLSGIRENTGNPSVNFSRNTAMFNQALGAKQQAFANKQNYDADSRFKADSFNIDARNKEQQLDITAANHIYNDYFSVAKDNAGTERQSAVSHLTRKMADYYKDEYAKTTYFDTVLDNYYYDGKDRRSPVKLDKLAQESIDLSPADLAYIKQQAADARKNKTTK